MGLFTHYVKTRPTRHKVGCRLSGLIKAVIQDDGFEVLLSGRFYMTYDFELSFGHNIIRNKSYEARQWSAATAKIPNGDGFRALYADKDIRHYGYDGIIDAITFALINEFQRTSARFRDLPAVFVDDEDCVVRACTLEYRNAEISDNSLERARLVGLSDKSHLYVETSASIGFLNQMAEQVAPDFVGGTIYSGPQSGHR